MPIVKGTIVKQNFTLIRSNPIVTSFDDLTVPIYEPESGTAECCFILTALAESSFTSEYFNDKHRAIFFWNNAFTTATMKLQKYNTSTGAWADSATLTDNTYGTYYAAAFHTTIYSEIAQGYELDWALILAALGEGQYRIKATGTTITSATVDKFSLEFELREYTTSRAENTVRIEWWLNGNIGDPNNDLIKQDYGTLNWYNQLRLSDSKFGFDEPELTREFVRYQSGKQVWNKSMTKETYLLKTGRLPNNVRRYLLYNVMNGDEVRITDFNSDNSVTHLDRYVAPVGGFVPKYTDGVKLAPVEIKFEQLYQNNEHKRC
jgi:hypothetical protein